METMWSMRTQGLTGKDLRNAILFGALVYLAIRFISQIADILLIFSVTVLIVLVLNPPVSWLAKHKVPRPVSAALIALSVIGLVGLAVYLIAPVAARQIQELWDHVPALAARASAWLRHFAASHPTIAQFIPGELKPEPQSLSKYVPSVLGGASRLTASAAGTIVGIFLVFITTIYAVANPRPLAEGFLRAVGPVYKPRLEAAGQRLSSQIKAWALGIVFAMVIVFGLTWIGLALIGIKQAFLFALIAGLFEAVPIIGPVLSAIPPIIVALVTDPILVVWIIVLFVLIQQIENHLLVPMIMSHQLRLHPVTVIFSVLVMGGLFGIVGVFLATPAAVTAGILYDELYLRGFQEERARAASTSPPDQASE